MTDNEKTKILYLGSFFPAHRKEEIIKNSIGVIQNAGDTYQKALLSGLIAHESCDRIITAPMLGSFPYRYKNLFYRGSKFYYEGIDDASIEVGFTNLTLYKNLSRYKRIKNELRKWLVENTNENKYVIIYSLDIAILRACHELKKKIGNFRINLIVTDLMEFMVLPKSPFNKIVMNAMEKKINLYLKSVDSFVILTKYMHEKLNINGRPYVIVEGIYEKKNIELSEKKETFKTILYSGTLAKVYGIDHLINAFKKIPSETYRLWICGDGDYKNEIIKQAKDDTRITYFGQIPRENVLSLQKKATVLINPRLSNSDFTKYSFASKTMEYLASGTPVIMHPLKGIPQEYHKYIYFSDNESDEGLMDTIIQVCEKTQDELNQFGKEASDFILKNKNPYIQVKKILSILN